MHPCGEPVDRATPLALASCATVEQRRGAALRGRRRGRGRRVRRAGVREALRRPRAPDGPLGTQARAGDVHTTGLLVKEVADAEDLPLEATRPWGACTGHRFGGSTSTRAATSSSRPTPERSSSTSPGVQRVGADIRCGRPFPGVRHGRVLVGADGPRSRVARSAGLGTNRSFLAGVELELEGVDQLDDRLHVFLDSRLARVHRPGRPGRRHHPGRDRVPAARAPGSRCVRRPRLEGRRPRRGARGRTARRTDPRRRTGAPVRVARDRLGRGRRPAWCRRSPGGGIHRRCGPGGPPGSRSRDTSGRRAVTGSSARRRLPRLRCQTVPAHRVGHGAAERAHRPGAGQPMVPGAGADGLLPPPRVAVTRRLARSGPVGGGGHAT